MTLPVRLENCAKSFGGTQILAPLDLEVKAGETLVLLGPSGCGKTTTLRLIAGLEQPDRGGRVLFGDRDVTALPIEKRRVGMVFQSYALFPNMSAAENVAYGLRVRGLRGAERDRRVARMLEMMRITELADRPIARLSGGQKQRVALARAIATEPDVLLLDEPLTALDAQLREVLRVEIDTLLRSLGITAIYVTHDQAEAMALGDRIAVLNRGRLAQIGPPREIWFSPADAFVAGFIGQGVKLAGEVAQGVLRCAGTTLPWAGPAGQVEVTLRPEMLALAEAPGLGTVAGTIQAAQFLGDRTRIAVALADAPAGSGASETAPVLVCDLPPRAALQPGAPVHLALDPASLIVLPQRS